MAHVKAPFITTILKSCFGLIGVVICIFLAQKHMGRRSMMLVGHGVSAVCMLGMGIAGTVAPNTERAGWAIVVLMMVYYAFYNGFSGALSWPISNELVSSRLRVLTMGTGTAINYVFACKCVRLSTHTALD